MIGYESLGLALLHFVWQGLLIAGALFVMLRMLSRAGAEARYVLSLLALASMVALPIVTLWDLENHVMPLRAATAGVVTGEAPPTRGTPSTGQVPVEQDVPPLRRPRPVEADAAPAGMPADAGAPPVARGERIGVVARIDSILRAGATLVGRRALRWTVWLWCVGVLLFSIRMLGGWVRLRRLTRLGTSAVPDAVCEAARVLARRIGIRRTVRLVRSARIAVPAVVGWIRPALLLPISALTGLTPAQLEAIIAHELAHVRRHDYLVNILQSVVETLLFYHPAVWWVSGQVRREREHCCDDLAVDVCGGNRRLYAGALLDLEVLRTPTPALAVAADGGSLVWRVRRLLRGDSVELRTLPRSKVGLMASTVAIFFMLACGGGALLAPFGDGGDEGPGFRIADGVPGPSSAKLFITDQNVGRVFRYDVSRTGPVTFETVLYVGYAPHGIAFDSAGEMFVANMFDPSISRFVDPVGPIQDEDAAITDPRLVFHGPVFMTFRNDELFVAQIKGNNVLRYTFDASGNAIPNGEIGPLSGDDGTRGIQVNPATGELFVGLCCSDHRILRFLIDPETGAAISNGDISGNGIARVHDMAFSPWGELFATSYPTGIVSRFTFDAAGNAIANGQITGLDRPIGLAFSPWGELFVSNHLTNVVSRFVFDPVSPTNPAMANGAFTVDPPLEPEPPGSWIPDLEFGPGD